MAPRTRTSAAREREARHQRMLHAGPVNTTGFSVLPTELLVTIVFECGFPRIPIPALRQQSYSKLEYLYHSKALCALSQTCRSLRAVFLPLLWERIEVCVNPVRPVRQKRILSYKQHQIHYEKGLATELVRQLEVVTVRDPTLAKYVRIINVTLTKFSSDTVMQEFVRCLQLLPNLHTIQIVRCPELFPNLHTIQNLRSEKAVSEDLKKALEGVSLPSVRTLSLVHYATAILSACPGARVITYFGGGHADILTKIMCCCPLVEQIRGISHIDYGASLPKMIEAFPKTRHIVFYLKNLSLTMDVVRQVANFPELTTLELDIDEHGKQETTRITEFEKAIRSFLANDPSFAGRRDTNLILTRQGKPLRVQRLSS